MSVRLPKETNSS